MSVDFYAQVTTPVGVADLLTTAGSVMAELLGLDDPDALAVVVGRVRLAGRLVGGGEVLTDRRLAAERIGPGAPNRSFDLVDAAGEELAAMLVSETSADCVLVVSPRPTARWPRARRASSAPTRPWRRCSAVPSCARSLRWRNWPANWSPRWTPRPGRPRCCCRAHPPTSWPATGAGSAKATG